MDFPLFFFDIVGNRLMMAVIAIVHVMINHPIAVGAYPLVAIMEWWAYQRNDPALDEVIRKVTWVLFIVTTSVGALTGVGIWFAAGLIAPFGIGSLLRVFFWAWFTEWLVFVSEVVLVLIYFLTWRRWAKGVWKRVHIGVGVLLALMSWFTMAIIVAILSFMMGIGSWQAGQGVFSAFFNPLYAPQLLFRTGFALAAAGFFVWFLLFFFTKNDKQTRARATRFTATWALVFTIPLVVGAIWYWGRIPQAMLDNLGVALLTQAYANWEATFLVVIGALVVVTVVFALTGLFRPTALPRVVLLIPFIVGLGLLAHFERAREFIRKPHIIADYMYSNGVTMTELPIYQRDGILKYATYVRHSRVTEANKVEAGRDVFIIACSRCHTTVGVNGVVARFQNLYGADPWDPNALTAFVQTMHMTRTFMPPFPGNEQENGALAAYLLDLQQTREPILGVQTEGLPPVDSAAAF